MRARYIFLNSKIFVFLILLSFPSLAGRHLSNEQADEVHRSLISQWKPVNYKQPLGFETVFQELDSTLWPAVPESYEWRISEDKKIQLFKHELAQDHTFDFVTYATESLSKFSFLSRWDGVTHHSFAYTRQNSPLSSYDDARNVFPISEFHYKGQTYMRGHCIDFLDTYGLSENSKVKGYTVIESISTLDPRNYIPEPRIPSPYWGESLRKDLVGKIRHEGECYAQYMHYGLTPLRTDDETATAIPQGVYFVRTKTKQSPTTTSYHVPWSYDFVEKGTKRNSSDHLKTLQAKGNFFPSPFVQNMKGPRKDLDLKELPIDYQLPKGELPWEEYHKITKIADHEIQSVTGKIILINYLLDQNYDPINIQKWLKRLIDHASNIHEKGGYGVMKPPATLGLLEKLGKNKEVDKDHSFLDHLRQLYHNDQDQAEKRDISTRSHLKPLKISERPKASPIAEIDVNLYSSKKLTNLVDDVFKQLHKEPRIRLLNLTTPRAKKIVEPLKAAFPSPGERKKISIEYTKSPKKGSPTQGIKKEFSQIGINPRKLEFSDTSSLESKTPSLPSTQNPPPPPKKYLKSLLETIQSHSTDLDTQVTQRLQRVKSNQTTIEYFTCPSVGDGDCFFHVAFTEPGESVHAVQTKAANMRRQLCDNIQQGQHVDSLRPLVYEHYMELLTNNEDHLEVPDIIKQKIKEKNNYTSMYNNMQHFGVPTNSIPSPENKFSVNEIQALVKQDHIKAYMERLRNVGGYDTYIPFRPGMLCPVDVLAGIGKRQINIFTFNITQKKLQFHKTGGTEGPIINILHADNHFTRLYLPDEGDNSFHQCEQIWANYLGQDQN